MKKLLKLSLLLLCISNGYSQDEEKEQNKELQEVTVQAVGSRNTKRTGR